MAAGAFSGRRALARRKQRGWPGGRSGVLRRASRACVFALGLAACDPAPDDRTAENAVRGFVERMVRFDGNPQDAEGIYARLSARTKKNLQARAERYSAASGRKITPAAMLVPARIVPRFSPRSYSAQVVGKYALVDVLGVRSGHRAQISCVLEESSWKIDLVLPELPPMRVGPGREP